MDFLDPGSIRVNFGIFLGVNFCKFEGFNCRKSFFIIFSTKILLGNGFLHKYFITYFLGVTLTKILKNLNWDPKKMFRNIVF